MGRFTLAPAALLLLLLSFVSEAAYVCNTEPADGFSLAHTCTNQCADGPQGLVGPGVLGDNYDVAAVYLGHQS